MARRIKARAFEHNQLGVTFFQSGAVDLAVEQFRLATRRASWVPSYWLNLGVALLEKGELDEAERALRRNLALNPESQSAYFHLGQLYHRRNDESASRRAYRKSVELAPYTYLAQRARERVEGWRPRLIIESGGKKAGDSEG